MSAAPAAATLRVMSNWTKNRLAQAADWANRRNAALTDTDLANGRTRKMEWAGKTLRVRVRAGRHGPRLDLLPSNGSRIVSLFVLGFLGLHWAGFGGGALGSLLQSIRAEVPNPTQIGAAVGVLLLLTLFYVPFVWLSVFDHDWSFEPHRATRRLNLLGVPVRERTYP